MKIFIDFDDVIFNTKEFSLQLREFFRRYGITQEMVKKYYYDSKDLGAVQLFDPQKFFERIEKNEGKDLTVARAAFEESLRDLSQYVFADVQKFLKEIGRENIFLVSFGIAEFQSKKILASGILPLIKKSIICFEPKAQAIAKIIAREKIIPNEELFFIDDRVEQIENVKTMFPKMHTLYLHRKEGRYCDEKQSSCDVEVHDLEQAGEIIKNLNNA